MRDSGFFLLCLVLKNNQTPVQYSLKVRNWVSPELFTISEEEQTRTPELRTVLLSGFKTSALFS